MPADPQFSAPPPGAPGGQPGNGNEAAPLPEEEEALDFDSGVKAGPAAAPLERRTMNRPIQPSPDDPPAGGRAVFEDFGEGGAPGSQTAEGKDPRGRGAPLEKKSGVGTKPFTRFVTRPETTVAANLASDQAPSERIISPSTASSPPAFGKIRHQQELDYRPSRLQSVMEEAWTHSRLGWLDHLGRAWAVFVALVVAGVAAIILWPYLREVSRKRETGPALAASPMVPLPPDEIRQAGIRRAFAAYLAAPGIAEKLPWVLDAQRVESRMKDFYLVQRQSDPVINSYEVSLPVRAGGEWWFTVTFVPADGAPGTILMKETPGGGLLDWENFVAYGSMPWEKFHAERPAAPQSMRVRLRLSSTYSGKYQSSDYLACEISHRSGPPVLRGYAAKNSRSGQQLAALEDLQDWKPLNLYLAWESDAGSPDAVLIGDLILNNWLDTSPGNTSRRPLPPAPSAVENAPSLPR